MLIEGLKWTQLVVAIATTILASFIWPGVMVAIPVAVGIFYVVSAAGAIRDWKPLVWSACLLSVAVAVLSTMAVVANDFAIFQIDEEMGVPPTVAVSSTGRTIVLDSIPASMLDQMRLNHASDVRKRKILVAMVLLVSIGSCAVVVMHGYAWKWLVFRNGSDVS